MSARTALIAEIEQRLRKLSPDRLRVVSDFLAYLEERECAEATQELLEIAGFEQALSEAEEQAKHGRVVPLNDVHREV